MRFGNKVQHVVYMYGEDESMNDHVIQSIESPDYTVEFIKDPREMLKKIQDPIPATVIIDLDVRDEKIPKAILMSIRKIYGTGLLVFAVTNTIDSPLAEFMKANGLSALVPKTIDKMDIRVRIVDVIEHTYFKKKIASEKQELEFPKIIEWFFETITPAVAMLSTTQESIEELETKYDYYQEKLLPYSQEFLKMVETLAKKKEPIHMKQAVRLYGIINCRNLVNSLTLSACLKIPFGWNEKTSLTTVDPAQFVQYSSKAYLAFSEEGKYHSVALACGLLYDMFHQMNESSPNKDPALKKQLENRFMDSINKIKAAFKKAKSIKELALEKHIITYQLCNELGKVMMFIYYKDYGEFIGKLEKNKASTPLFVHFAENDKYQITHEMLSSLLCQLVPALEGAAHAILYRAIPLLLEKEPSEHDNYTLAQFCNTSM